MYLFIFYFLLKFLDYSKIIHFINNYIVNSYNFTIKFAKEN